MRNSSLCNHKMFSLVVMAAAAVLQVTNAFSFPAIPGWIRGNTNIKSSASVLLFGQNPFRNGGYDPSEPMSSAQWTPLQAAEFVVWHSSDPATIGKQLTPLIPHWSGRHVGEFISRLYMGEKSNYGQQQKLTFESKNVQTPQWNQGLDSIEGQVALQELLRTALPSAVLRDQQEFLQLARTFLWKQYTWPVTAPDAALDVGSSDDAKKDNKQSPSKKKPKRKEIVIRKPILESDSFAKRGYTNPLLQIWKELRRDRVGLPRFNFTAEHVLELALDLDLQKQELNEQQLPDIQECLELLQVQVTPAEKVHIVQGLAKASWNPTLIAQFVSILSPPPPLEALPEQRQQVEQHNSNSEHRPQPIAKPRLMRLPTKQRHLLPKRPLQVSEQPTNLTVATATTDKSTSTGVATSNIQQRIQKADAERRKLEQQTTMTETLSASSSFSNIQEEDTDTDTDTTTNNLVYWSTVPPLRDTAKQEMETVPVVVNMFNTTMDGLPYFGVTQDYMASTTTTSSTRAKRSETNTNNNNNNNNGKPWQ